MAKCGYAITSGGVTALSAATARTILGLKAHANSGMDLKYAKVGFDGVAASAVPVLVELCYCTWATKSPGTNSTDISSAIKQTYGRVITVGATAGKDWAAGNEPTVLSVIDEFLLTPNGGLYAEFQPLGNEWDCAVAEGFAIRCTAPANVNVRAAMRWERI